MTEDTTLLDAYLDGAKDAISSASEEMDEETKLLAEAEALMAKANALKESVMQKRESKRNDSIAEINAAIDGFNGYFGVTRFWTAQQLFPEFVIVPKGSSVVSSAGEKAKADALYRNPSDHSQTWAGRGKRPNWVTALITAGGKLEDCRIVPLPPVPVTPVVNEASEQQPAELHPEIPFPPVEQQPETVAVSDILAPPANPEVEQFHETVIHTGSEPEAVPGFDVEPDFSPKVEEDSGGRRRAGRNKSQFG